MKSVRWNPEHLIDRNGGPQGAIGGVVAAAERGERIRVQIERSESHHVLGRSPRVVVSKARFREGCIKAVESRIWPLPERGRVLAEIHRRLDQVPESECGSDAWLSDLASIFDFAGAWALAAHLMRAGLSVDVVEGDHVNGPSKRYNKNADVVITIPVVPVEDA